MNADTLEDRLRAGLAQLGAALEAEVSADAGSLVRPTPGDPPVPTAPSPRPARRWLAAAAAVVVLAAGVATWQVTRPSSGTVGTIDQPDPTNPTPTPTPTTEPPTTTATSAPGVVGDGPVPGGTPTAEVLAVGEVLGLPELTEWWRYPGGGWRATYSAPDGATPLAEVSVGLAPDLDDPRLQEQPLGEFLLPGSTPAKAEVAGVEAAFVRGEDRQVTVSGLRDGWVIVLTITDPTGVGTEPTIERYEQVLAAIATP